MAIVTAQQLNSYYERYKNKEITFNKEVIRTLGLLPKFVFIKLKIGQIPCIIYSTSMVGAKILLNLDEKTFKSLQETVQNLSLRYSFKNADKSEPMNFFVPCHIGGISKYKESQDLYFMNLNFSQRPPDDLVRIIGTTLDAMASAAQRSEERIIITNDTQHRLSLETKNTNIFIDSIPRNAIIRDLSFSGAKVIILGNAKFLVNKDFILNIPVKGTEKISIPGKILRHEDVEGRRDICALALKFDDGKVPMKYKVLLNDYFQSIRKK